MQMFYTGALVLLFVSALQNPSNHLLQHVLLAIFITPSTASCMTQCSPADLTVNCFFHKRVRHDFCARSRLSSVGKGVPYSLEGIRVLIKKKTTAVNLGTSRLVIDVIDFMAMA